MLWRASPPRFRRDPPTDFIVPCNPKLVSRPPAEPGWLHEVKHDDFRILVRKQGERVQVWSRRAQKLRIEQGLKVDRDASTDRNSWRASRSA
jgi:hypothetical protein